MEELVLTIIFLVLAFIGIIDSGYLSFQHLKKKKLVCMINENGCNIVAESKWSTIFGVKNDYLGFLYYLGLFVLMIVSFYVNVSAIILLITSLGLLFSIFLMIIMIFVIRNFCLYCTISAVVSLLLFLVSIMLYIIGHTF